LLPGCFGETVFSFDGIDASPIQGDETRIQPAANRTGDPWRQGWGGSASDDGGGVAADPRSEDAMSVADGPLDQDSADSSRMAIGPGDANASEAAPPVVTQPSPPSQPSPLPVAGLSNIGTADFHISLTVTTMQSARSALINQRAVCWFGGFWDIRLVHGALLIETCDSSVNYTTVTTQGPLVNDGRPHRVIVERVRKRLTVFIDGIASGGGLSNSAFGLLPPVSRHDPCEMAGEYGPFVGSIANLSLMSP
jgi:hypothetical protein